MSARRTTGALLDRGYRRCARITRRYGTTYYWGTLLLPPVSRRHVYAVYTLCRLADDVVDAPGATDPDKVAGTAAGLHRLAQRLERVRAGEPTNDPVLAAIGHSVRACGIHQECFTRFFAAMAQDLTQTSYPTWQDLLEYMDGSAAVIGEMMLPVLQPVTRDASIPARALGLAFQLTNFLRDVAEDLDRGRVYLPQEDLARFGADPRARTVTPAWRELMAFEIERNRALYRAADRGIPLLPPASARCVGTARALYAQILQRIEARDYDVFTTRAHVPTRRKAALAARTLLTGTVPGAGATRQKG